MAPSVLCGKRLQSVPTYEKVQFYFDCLRRSVINPRTGQRAALKKIPNVNQSLLACIRTYREVKILCEMRHDNVSEIVE